MTYKEMEEHIFEIDKELKATDKRFNKVVSVSCVDGSSFLIHHAFYETTEHWVIVFCEHFRPFLFAEEDVAALYEYEVKRGY